MSSHRSTFTQHQRSLLRLRQHHIQQRKATALSSNVRKTRELLQAEQQERQGMHKELLDLFYNSHHCRMKAVSVHSERSEFQEILSSLNEIIRAGKKKVTEIRRQNTDLIERLDQVKQEAREFEERVVCLEDSQRHLIDHKAVNEIIEAERKKASNTSKRNARLKEKLDRARQKARDFEERIFLMENSQHSVTEQHDLKDVIQAERRKVSDSVKRNARLKEQLDRAKQEAREFEQRLFLSEAAQHESKPILTRSDRFQLSTALQPEVKRCIDRESSVTRSTLSEHSTISGEGTNVESKLPQIIQQHFETAQQDLQLTAESQHCGHYDKGFTCLTDCGRVICADCTVHNTFSGGEFHHLCSMCGEEACQFNELPIAVLHSTSLAQMGKLIEWF